VESPIQNLKGKRKMTEKKNKLFIEFRIETKEDIKRFLRIFKNYSSMIVRYGKIK